MKIENSQLQKLMKRTLRVANISGKDISQVNSCIIALTAHRAITCNIVRDGVTSVSSFGVDRLCTDPPEDEYYIPDIAKFLGVLKHHGELITVEQTDTKLRIKSTGKQTTLAADPRAKAFPHSDKTLEQWRDMSYTRRFQYDTGQLTYKTYTGKVLSKDASATCKAGELSDALSSGLMNGQKCPSFQISANPDTKQLKVLVGSKMGGETYTDLEESQSLSWDTIEITASGLENTFSLVERNRDVKLVVFDLSKEGASGALLAIEIVGIGIILQRVSYV